MILVLLIACLLSTVFGCLDNDIPPCSCTSIDDKLNEITCKGATDFDELEKSLTRLSDEPVQTLYIIDSYLLYLPSDTLEGKEVQRLHLLNSTFQDLTDSEVAFEGFGKTLKSFIIEDCRIFNGFKWDEFQNLDNLLSLKTIDVGLEDIDSDVESLALLPHLKKIQLTQDIISYIDDTAFANFQKLTDLSLERNLISELKRSMFPDPAPRLSVINLNYNKIETFPEGMFANMPSLENLLLMGNNIATVEQKTFYPLFKHATRVYLDGNPIRCDCRMKWIYKLVRHSYVVCMQPPHFANQYIDQLEADDFKC